MEHNTYLCYIVNIMAADVLAMQGAKASATMILTLLNWDNSVAAWSISIISPAI